MNQAIPTRCRLVLIMPDDGSGAADEALAAALSGGDVASVILPQYELDEVAFQRLAERRVPVVQAAGAAAMVAGDTRVAAQTGADGVHFEGDKSELADLIERHASRMMVGTGGAKTRDDALELGEERPDYMFFGRFGYDTQPEPHNRNLSLGRWWAEMIEVPCIVMGGNTVGSVRAVAETGAEFVALSAAVLKAQDPAAAVGEVNALLDAHAPRFTESA